jgi:hypothetical protein
MGMDTIRINFILWQRDNPTNHNYGMSKVQSCLRGKIKVRQDPVSNGAIMEVEYIYCPSCGYEDYDVFVGYSRTTASGDVFICPKCKQETTFVYNEQDKEQEP